jgi:hypothetical protein
LKRKILLLGSSHGRGIGPMPQETLGSNFEVSSIVKPNAPLAKAVEDLVKLGKGLAKQDHIVIMGGPGNSLDRHYHYAIEKDLNFIAERMTNTNVAFSNLLKRHDKMWMDGMVMRVNLRLDRAMMGHDKAHIGITDVTYFVRDDYTTHGLHLNSLGKRRLMHLIAERISGGHVSSVSSIPVIVHGRA